MYIYSLIPCSAMRQILRKFVNQTDYLVKEPSYSRIYLSSFNIRVVLEIFLY